MRNVAKQGLLQAVGVALYCTTIGTIMQNGNKFFGQADTFITPIAVLTMLCVSVLICALIVFKKPYELFFEGKKKEALDVVIYTAISLFIFLLILFVAMAIIK